MTLNRRYRRNIKSNFSFYLSITLLTLLAVFMDLLFSGVVTGERKYLDSFRETAKCEDGQFVTYQELTEDDIERLEADYDVVIEKQQYFDCFIEEDYRLRVFSPNEKLNDHVITEGSDLTSDTDILISSGLAKARRVKLGDKMSLNDNDYVVCGFFARIDYLLMLESSSDSISNPREFGIAMVTDRMFESFEKEDVSSYYSVTYHADNELEFRKELNKKYMTAHYLPADSNARINTVLNLIDRYSSFSVFILPVMLIGIVLLMAVIVGRKVRSEQRQFGVLLSHGYRQHELAVHYMFFGMIPGLAGSIFGVLAAILSIPPVGEVLFTGKIEPLPITYDIEWSRVMIGLFAPAIVYGFFAWYAAFRVMKKDPVDMMRGTVSEVRKNIFRMEKSKKSIHTKYMLRAVFGNMSRTFIVILGIAIGSMLLVYSLVCADSMQAYVDHSVDEAGRYNYLYFLTSLQTEPVENGVELLAATYEIKDHKGTLKLIGLDDAKLVNDETETGKMDLSSDKFYITLKASIEFSVNNGDTISLLDTRTMEEHDAMIAGIVSNDSQNTIYSSRKAVSEIIDAPADSYNAVMSEVQLPNTGSEIYHKITIDDLKSQIQNITDQMNEIVHVMLLFGGLICVIAVYLMVNILLSENASTISMLKILGLRNNEIHRMTTHIYHWLVPIGIILGCAMGYYAAAANFKMSVANYHVYFTPYLKASSIVICIAVVVMSYIVSLALLGRKIHKADLTYCLKNTNE